MRQVRRRWDKPQLWYGVQGSVTKSVAPQMSDNEVQEMVLNLRRYENQDYTLVSWNGLGFDLDIVAEESDMSETCRCLALNHVDMMFQIYQLRGYPVSLAAVGEGMNIANPKSTEVSGKSAPQMWADGNYQTVLDYCAQDARATLEIAEKVERQQVLRWFSKRGNLQWVDMPGGWLTVRDALALPDPDTSWMDSPIPLSQFTGWLGEVR